MTISNRSKSIKVADPVAYFSSWAYRIDQHHYETLGLGYRQFMKDKKPTWSWAIMEPVEYRFETGYIFYDGKDPEKYLQIAADWDAFHIEVHEGLANQQKSRRAYAVTTHDLSEWLKSGVKPDSCKQLDMPQSKAGILAWEIANESICEEPLKVALSQAGNVA